MRIMASLYLDLYCSSLSRSSCCLPMGYYSSCSISTNFLSAVTNFLCFSSYRFFSSSFSFCTLLTNCFNLLIVYFSSFRFGLTACLSIRSLICFSLSRIVFLESLSCPLSSSDSVSFFLMMLSRSRMRLKLI